MKIKILTKNNNTIYEISEGAVFTETKNETLDSGTVVIDNQAETISLEPYDLVAIYYNDGTFWKHMCVDTYTESMICVNPKIYRYEITLFSETKQLEGIVLPNLKITKNGVGSGSSSISNIGIIFDYIDCYMAEYSRGYANQSDNMPYVIKWRKEQSTSGTEEYALLQKLEEKFNNWRTDICPEMQWNNPTLREVLNDLMMVKDCIPIIKNGVLSFIDLTEVRNDITEDEHINYITKSKSSEDYVSELQVKLENVTNENVAGTHNSVNRTEYIMFAPPGDSIITTNSSMVLKTTWPIYRLKKLVMCYVAGYIASIGTPSVSNPIHKVLIKQDLVSLNLVPEYQQWMVRPIVYNTAAPGNLEDFANTQNWSLYYTRGGNTIENWLHNTKFFWQSQILYEELMSKIFKYQYPQSGQSGMYYYPDISAYYNIYFEIEYETLAGSVFRASKGDGVEHTRVVIDNQTNAMVDSYSQGFLEYQKANRLGNEQTQINARYNNNSSEPLISIGDYYNDAIVYQCQYQFFKDHIEVNAQATKNYILRNYFTGVKSKIRSWQVVSANEATERHDIQKYYCEFSWYLRRGTTISFYSNRNLPKYFATPLIQSLDIKPLKYCFVKTNSGGTSWHPNELDLVGDVYSLDLITRITGNSLVLTFGFSDNLWVGASVDGNRVNINSFVTSTYGDDIKLKSTALAGGGFPLSQKQYTDNLGSFKYLVVTFSGEMNPFSYGDLEPGDLSGYTTEQIQNFYLNIWDRPGANSSNIVDKRISINVYHRKDSQETYKLSTQFEFCSETSDISFTKHWLERQEAIRTVINNPTFKLIGYQLKNPRLFNFKNPNEFPDNSEVLSSLSVDVDVDVDYGSEYDTQEVLCSRIDIKTHSAFSDSEQAINFFKSRNNWAWYLVVASDDGGTTQYASGSEPILVLFTNIPNDNITSDSNKGIVSMYLNLLDKRYKTRSNY